MNGFGEQYLLVGCLNKAELDSLNDFNPHGFVAENVARFKAEYASEVRNGSKAARQPTLNLVTGCFEGQDRILRGRNKWCPADNDGFQEYEFSPGVLRKRAVVMTAYYRQRVQDMADSQPRYSAPVQVEYAPYISL